MSQPPDDLNIPDDAMPPDDDGDNSQTNMPPGAKKRKVKVSMSQSAHDVKFSDMFGITLAPMHGILKFGVFHPETGEFVVHTQIALTPQGLMSLSQTLQKNIEKVKKRKPGPGTSMN